MRSLDEIRGETRVLQEVIFDLERIVSLHRRQLQQNEIEEKVILDDMHRQTLKGLAF